MGALMKLAAVGVGAWVAYRAKGAHDMQVPWDVAFKYPFEDLAVLNRQIWDASHPMGAAPAVALAPGQAVAALATRLVGMNTFGLKPLAPSSADVLMTYRRT